MSHAPQKLQYGASESEVSAKINEICDYLRQIRIVADPQTMLVSETSAGTVLSVLPQETVARMEAGAGALGIGVVPTPPPSGGGPGAYRKITLNADGTWEAAGEEIPIIFPAI